MLKQFRKSADQGAERYRRARLTALMNVISQIVQVATGLISVPLALSYVGAERFGIWMTLSTALTFITFSDLGVGIGLQDRMTRFLGAEDYVRARSAFVGALFFVTGLFFVLMGASEVLVPKFDLVEVFSLKSQESINEIYPTAKMVIFVLGLGLVSGIVQRAFNAMQEGFWVAVIQVVARVLSLVLLFVVVDLKMGLPALVFVVGGLTSVGLLIFGLPILFVRNEWLALDIKALRNVIDVEILKDVLKVGSLGLGAAVAIYFVNNSIPVLMARQYGAEGVADYAVLLKLVSVPGLLLTYILLPLWPAITEAKVKNENGWIKTAYKKSILFTALLSVVSVVVLMIFGRDIIFSWTGDKNVVPSGGLILACAVFMVIGYWNTVTSVILNGLSKYKGQATYGIVLAIFFAFLAAFVPAHWPKEMIVWVVGFGYFLRCLIMQWEVYKSLYA